MSSSNALKQHVPKIAIGCLVTSVVFYVISGLMVAVSPNEDLDNAIPGGEMTKAGLKLMDAQPDKLNDI
jgi:hypothetical protein